MREHATTSARARMRAYVAHPPFGMESIRMIDRTVPTVRAGTIVVRMHAVALNYRDVLVATGVGVWRPQVPRILASDGVGRVIAVGDGVAGVRLGDRVAGTFYPQWIDGEPNSEKLAGPLGGATADGVLAEYVVFHASSVVRLPEYLSDVEAATLPCAAVTAWHAIAERHRVRPGETVVVQGTGGVSLFALQFARLRGADVILTSSSDEKLDRARALGARHGLNYRSTPAWDEEVLQLTEGRGADHVLDVVGAENLNRSMHAVRIGGTVSVIGLLRGTAGGIDTYRFAQKSARLHGIDVGSRAMFEAMNAALAAHHLRPVVDHVFAFSEARDALRYLASGAHFGKVVITLCEPGT